jgi:hypothetical protein
MVVNARCDGSIWINSSDRNLKTNFALVNATEILDRVTRLCRHKRNNPLGGATCLVRTDQNNREDDGAIILTAFSVQHLFAAALFFARLFIATLRVAITLAAAATLFLGFFRHYSHLLSTSYRRLSMRWRKNFYPQQPRMDFVAFSSGANVNNNFPQHDTILCWLSV